MTAESFLQQFMPYRNRLYRLSLRLLGNQADAADLVQDVYLKLWNMRDQMDQYSSTEAFAMTMTKNLCFDRLKSAAKQSVRIAQNHNLVDNLSPDKLIEFDETYSSIEEFISNLPEVQQLVMHLRDIENYQFDDIAQITGLSPNNIRVSLSRARKTVREQLMNRNGYGYKNY
jgi:RNA polymerase sigma-70 factor (ECF subfamily)